MSEQRPDWWARIVAGVPEIQRHHSGSGFKRIPTAAFDFNAVHWLTEPDGFMLEWLDDQSLAEDVMPGDVIFIHEPWEDPAFGFLFPVLAVRADRVVATLAASLEMRFQTWVEDALDKHRPRPWRKERVCSHLTPHTRGPAATMYVACSECGTG